MTLLKNADNTLPLDKKKKYFLTGPLAADNRNISGCWATCAPFTNPVSVKQAFDDAGINYEYFDAIPFVERYQSFHITDESNFAKALEIAADCDEIIYVCGELASWSGENRGRVDIDLPPIQNKYLDALKSSGKKVTSVLMTGRAMSVAHLDKMSDALLLAWHAGTFTGTAVVDILFGDYNPSGRLPITFPYYTGQIPIYHSILSSGRSRESLIRYKDGENKPLYPFGYGLSYSELSYSDIAIETPVIKAGDTIRASVTVTNSSDRDADEVVQAYYCDVVSSLATPERKLCGFDKVTVPANSSVKVTLEIPSERIALMTKDLVEVIEPGEFVLYIGHDSICTDSVSFVVEE